MVNERELHRLVTQFLLDTCRYTTTATSEYACEAFLGRCLLRSVGLLTLLGDSEVFSSGSTAEFYIRPILPCVGDIDYMVCHNSCIAMPSGQTPPTELLGIYHRSVNVYEIIDSHQPGYVYLQPSLYFLTKVDSGHYVAKKRENGYKALEFLPRSGFGAMIQSVKTCNCMTIVDDLFQLIAQHTLPISIQDAFSEPRSKPDFFPHGPAFSNRLNENSKVAGGPATTGDLVSCMRCQVWPPQAADWPKRSRSHGWPDVTTIPVVVSNGCDVVPAVHPSCRQDEWMNEHQWRLSFSRAEVTLLNSWTPVQQIIYHMLRFLMKHEVLLKTNFNDPDVPTVSNYHIKTLMLWECEQKPQSWWSAESSVVKLCSSLLHKLCGCVADKHCQHYFINNCNLVGHFQQASITICNSLKTVSNESFLLKWFVENYIRKCAQLCWTDMSLFDDNPSIYSLQRATDTIVDEKLNRLKGETVKEFYLFEIFINVCLSWLQGICSAIVVKKELQNVDLRIQDYLIAVASLSVAYKLSLTSLTDDLLERLWMLFDPCSEDNVTSNSRNFLPIRKAIKLTTLPSVGSDALEMLHNEMSKAYLHQFLTCGQESTDCILVVHVLLAALYYKSGHYLSTIDHCKQVLNKHGREQCALRSIGAEFLPRIDDSVDSVFGLIVFYQHVWRNVTNIAGNSEPTSNPAFTTYLMAQYLYSRCSDIAATKGNEVAMYQLRLFQSHRLLLGDILLFKVMKPQLNKCMKVPIVEFRSEDTVIIGLSSIDTTIMVTLLELVALEKLTAYRQHMVRELHSEEYPVLNEFEALLAYKCGLFEKCLKICRSNVNILLTAPFSLQMYWIAMPEFLSLLDGELVSLYGIIRLLQPGLWLVATNHLSHCQISILTLSLYLMVQCQKRLHYASYNETFEVIRCVHQDMICDNNDNYFTDRLILRMIYRSLKLHVDSSCAN